MPQCYKLFHQPAQGDLSHGKVQNIQPFLPMQQKWVKLALICILCTGLVYLGVLLYQRFF
jgi:hypothetical protein